MARKTKQELAAIREQERRAQHEQEQQWRQAWPQRLMRLLYELTALPAESGVHIAYELCHVTAEGRVVITGGSSGMCDRIEFGPETSEWELDVIRRAVEDAIEEKRARERREQLAKEAKALLTDEQLEALGLRR